ncbi:MAG: LOG family protein [Candidatus Synoicihabitans palmerolidicus]|nr:LOG family protein [Candidatus Synoicihabitans palmerolidicus]
MLACRQVESTRHVSIGCAAASPSSLARSASSHISIMTWLILRTCPAVKHLDARSRTLSLGDPLDAVDPARSAKVGQQIAGGDAQGKFTQADFPEHHAQYLHPPRLARELQVARQPGHVVASPVFAGKGHGHRFQVTVGQQLVEPRQLIAQRGVIFVGSDRSQVWTQPSFQGNFRGDGFDSIVHSKLYTPFCAETRKSSRFRLLYFYATYSLPTSCACGTRSSYWFNPQLDDLFIHTYKKDHGFFIREEMQRCFQESPILAFYGSAVGLSEAESARIATLIDTLTSYMGPNVGVLTGGGGGAMGLACEQARAKGALTGACFLELEAQPPKWGVDFYMGVDFYNTFQESFRHFRQKWFEVADFCIFNVGGVGTLEEIGIELCNIKLGIRPRVPFVFFNSKYFRDLKKQLTQMVRAGRAPAWILDYILFTDDPEEVVAFYREKLQVL